MDPSPKDGNVSSIGLDQLWIELIGCCLTGADFEFLGPVDEIGDPISGLTDEDGRAQSHATLAGGTESCSNLIK